MRIRLPAAAPAGRDQPISSSPGVCGCRPTARPAAARTARSTTSATGIPQMAVYDDVNGWQTDQYLRQRRVLHGLRELRRGPDRARRLAGRRAPAPAEPREVLTAQTRARLDSAAHGGGIVHVVSESDRGAGKATTGGTDGKLTWRFGPRTCATSPGPPRRSICGTRPRPPWATPTATAADTSRDRVVLSSGAADQPLGRGRPLRPALDPVLLQVSLALSLPAHDRGGRADLVRRHGIPDDDLHRGTVGHPEPLRGHRPTRSGTCGSR